MTEIYLIRHCEALGNVMHLLQGVTDFDISELGEKQLEYITERFKNIDIDKVFSSNLKRTLETAKAVAVSKNLEVEICDGLTEINCGIYEGKPFRELLEEIPEFFGVWNNHPQDLFCEGGESMREAYERIWQTVLHLAKTNQGKTVAAASHGGVLRCLHCRLLFGDISRLKDVDWSLNTAVTLLRFDDNGNVQMVFYNDASHLPEGLIPEGSKISNFDKGANK